ncbi:MULTISPECIES: 4-oxalocrotonate tautomerase family protein [Nitrincola]|uniref:Tautomerase n=1 Tax=Nitrincola nitratireducens TaxID=1229521 RepID=W9UY60_9GAMM|nr:MULTISPECIES: 4-oxalocrotonate tautomerase family protein [Nitrincola]EXJ12014.1 4-oxalocrotonate tautomerase [Nitrincola nitratireducens]
MPIAQLYIMEGRSDEQKERLIASITESIASSLDTPIDAVRVIITEMPKQHFGIAGKSAKQLGR